MGDINLMYTWAIQTCDAPDIGYSQTYRNQRTVNGVTYYDCSSFVNYALLAGDFETHSYAPENNAFTTRSMGAELLRLGWDKYTTSSTFQYLPGDIGLSSTHTEICYTAGTGKAVFMGAHTRNASLENQVSIGGSNGDESYQRTFPTVYRYGTGGAVGEGASVYVVAALCGNAWRESYINPGLEQMGAGDGYGLFQWSGERRTSLEDYALEQGTVKSNPQTQLDFLIYEDFWIGSYGGISSLADFMQSQSDDIEMLTTAFMECWELPGTPELQERIDHAYECYDYIRLHAQDSKINSWVVANRVLTKKEILNNAVMMYRVLSAGGGGGGIPTLRKKGLPVWARCRKHFYIRKCFT